MHPSKYPGCHYLMLAPVLCGWSNYLLDIPYRFEIRHNRDITKENVRQQSFIRGKAASTGPLSQVNCAGQTQEWLTDVTGEYDRLAQFIDRVGQGRLGRKSNG
jgi:hypothetical protein